MAAPPVPHDWTLLEQATSANLQSLTDTLDFLKKPPRCRVTRLANKPITTNTLTLMDWDGEDYDPNGFHSTVTNNSRITPNVSGLYEVKTHIGWATNATSRRFCSIYKNGVVAAQANIEAASASTTEVTVSKKILFNGTTDYVEAQVYQQSGGNLDVEAATNRTWFEVIWVALDETTAF